MELRRNQLRKRRGNGALSGTAAQGDRRGVLLMVVLSMLALFLLLGTAFLVSSNFYADTAKTAGKLNRTENNPTDLLERAMLQVLRDTNNPSSAIRYHSLLRDVYGSDGFVGRVYIPTFANQTPAPAELMAPKFAGATLGNLYGPTNGQLIEIYMLDDDAPDDFRNMAIATPGVPEAGDIIALEQSPTGMPRDYDPSTANDYYAGSLLTMLSGPAKGQSTRIVDYEFVGTQPEFFAAFGDTVQPIYRLRIMSINKTNGETLTALDPSASPSTAALADFYDQINRVGHAFMVNGRAFNGTGVGFNRLAAAGTARLNAVEVLLDPSNPGTPLDALELALTPNGQFMNPFWYNDAALGASVSNIGGVINGAYQPFGYEAAGDQLLYTTYEGPGGSDDSYDAVDYQNMFLAHMPLTPRGLAGIVAQNPDGPPLVLPLDAQQAINLCNSDETLRLDLENTIIPSFHRPALANYWQNRLLRAPWFVVEENNEDTRAEAILFPYGEDGIRGNDDDPNVDIQLRDVLASVKRKMLLRPSYEDHPNFDGSNTLSRSSRISQTGLNTQAFALNGNIRYPAWEVVGPWDVDNDNDGINDSIWVDLGDPVQETENGTLYKPLYAFLIVDLDNKLNLNAHGSVDHFAATNFDPTNLLTGNIGNLTGGEQFALGNTNTQWTSNVMPVGMGWGPGDVSLRSILSPLTQPYHPNYLSQIAPSTPHNGRPLADDYARLFAGRFPTDLAANAIWGRYGSAGVVREATGLSLNAATMNTQPGTTFDNPLTAGTVEALAGTPGYRREQELPYEFIGYPVADQVRSQRLGAFVFAQPSSFGSSPDLRSRYAVGIDYTGQPTYESAWDSVDPTNFANSALLVPLVDDSQYETNLASDGRRGAPSGLTAGDDAPFATAELERILRAYDSETGTAPSRLWELVDTFDPNKYAITVASNPNNITPEELALAQVNSNIARRQVTTDSYEIPTPADVVPSYITELGPDGLPGNAGVDDDNADSDNDGNEFEDVVPFNIATGLGEIGWYEVDPNDPRFLSGWSDDFASLVGKSVAEARLVDVLWYRIQRERAKRYEWDRVTRPYNWNNPQAVAILNNIAEQLLAPEVLAGYKMDINRPFGDGRDNNGNGIVDEPIEAGEPWVDADGDGVWDDGEPFIDLDGDGQFYADKDRDGIIDRVDLNNDGNFDSSEQVVDNLWAAQLGGNAALVANAMSKDVAQAAYADVNGNGLREPAEALQPVVGMNNDNHLARQLYARHLYCMMMILTDEDYLAPIDPNDAQARRYIRLKAQELEGAGLDAFRANVEARRKYTCRQMAQWAANCCDFRDSDACMTPFEYDENPFDGWNCVDTNGTPADPTDDVFYPLDSDPATDENHGQRVNWAAMGTNGQKVLATRAPNANFESGARGMATVDNELNPLDCNRNIVWGAERPELLITETMAFHDLRQEDLAHADPEASGDKTTAEGGEQDEPDDDLDQRLRPRGSLFVELHNPWSGDGQKPAELYRYRNLLPHAIDASGRISNPDSPTFRSGRATYNHNDRIDLNGDGAIDVAEGVLLNRLSNIADSDGKRSPVWRMIVVEEFPEYRNPDGIDERPVARDDQSNERTTTYVNRPTLFHPTSFSDYDRRNLREHSNTQFRPTDPDWDEMLTRVPVRNAVPKIKVPMGEWIQKQTGEDNLDLPDYQNMPQPMQRQLFSKPYPFIEREFYFTSGNRFFSVRQNSGEFTDTKGLDQARNYTNLSFLALQRIEEEASLRIPFNFVTRDNGLKYGLTFRFPGTVHGETDDVEIAPILPGRYAVVGSAGTMYLSGGAGQPFEYTHSTGETVPRFVTGVGRFVTPGRVTDTDDDIFTSRLSLAKRVEMMPSPNPFLSQFMIAGNGGQPGNNPGDRDNELFFIATTENVFLNDRDPENLDVRSNIVAPVVVVPIEDMNVSEPVYGYEVREEELERLQPPPVWSPLVANGEGGYTTSGLGAGAQEAHYDIPFDVDQEFKQEGTVPNYRVVHLQRLADPTLPWNPRPEHFAHESVPTTIDNDPIRQQHDPRLPINPYLTVDSASVDLTVFNGTSSSQKYPRGDLLFRAKERGARAVALNGAGMPQPLRAIWRQERASTEAQFNAELGTLPSPARRRASLGGVLDRHNLRPQHFDFIFNHSLGYANRAFGDIFLQQGAYGPNPNNQQLATMDPTDDPNRDNNPRTFGSATGAPRQDTSGLASTFPWFTWNNRPYIGENELLQVPATSSSRMLWDYSVMEPITDPLEQPNVYEGARVFGHSNNNQVQELYGANATNPSLVSSVVTNSERYKVHRAPYGSLQNMLLSSTVPAAIISGKQKQSDPDTEIIPVPVGAPNFHRILDYLHAPSRYVATDTLLNPQVFSANSVLNPDDPRASLLAPFNRVADYREPGKVNLNTAVGQRIAPTDPNSGSLVPGVGVPQIWSDVYDGLTHRIRDANLTDNNNTPANPNDDTLLASGHFGPAWRDIVLSRRGYVDPMLPNGSATGVDRAELILENTSPTFFANPFRSSEAADLVPLPQLLLSGLRSNTTQQSLAIYGGSDASMLRRHPFSPGSLYAWSNVGDDLDANVLVDDAREAGFGDDSIAFPAKEPVNRRQWRLPGPVPLFSELASTAAIDGTRNPGMHYMPLTRLDNLTTTRSGVFAVWVTVGYFEVGKAPQWDGSSDEAVGTRAKFTNQAGGDVVAGRALYNRVYPQGYQLGKEIGSETGDIDRQRAFYIIDRTRPVAFKPGEDVNVEDAILLRRRIE